MSEVQRFWCHEASNIRCVREADFDRVTAERDALQALLNKADQELDGAGAAYLNKNAECLALRERADVLEGLLHRVVDSSALSFEQDAPEALESLEADICAALKPAESQQCQFPQSCPSNCGCDIPDFTPGNGNKARRRAAAIEALKPENQRIVPVDPFTTCLNCFGTGTICTGILEASSTICNGCNGTGREQP